MKRKLVLFLILLGIVGISIAIYQMSAGKPKYGVLRVSSNPTASVLIDDKSVGRTPYEDKYQEGEYLVKIVPETASSGLVSWQNKIIITRNLLTYINVQLSESEFTTASDVLWLEKITSNKSEISIITNPDGASVVLDGESRGVTPLVVTDVSAGDHTMILSSPGFTERSVKVKTTSQYRLIANIKLPLSQEQKVTDITEATPSGLLATPTPTGKSKITSTPTPTDPDKPFVIIKETPTGFLRVRVEPSISASESGRVNPGDKYSILDSQNGWYKIQLNTNDSGWISGQYASKVE